MKKFLLLLAAAASVGSVQAQQEVVAPATKRTVLEAVASKVANLDLLDVANKTTYVSDTGYMTLSVFLTKGFANVYTRQIFDTSRAYRSDTAPYDSGYLLGPNPSLDRGFAEKVYFRYKSDTSLRILGFRALFAGKVNPTTTRQITFGLWSSGPETRVPGTTGQYNEGLPTNLLASKAVSIKDLGISGTGVDTIKNHFLTTPHMLAASDSDFFVGYTMPAYTWSSIAGDTFSLRSSRTNYYFNTGSYLRGSDTVHANQNVFMNNAGMWDDLYWNFGLRANLSIIPIVQLTTPTGVDQSFTARDLTFFGNYPNPAVEATTVRFSLESATDVTLVLSDLNGRTVRTVPAARFDAGMNEISINVSDLAAGNYVYTILSGKGGAVASQLTVVR